MDIITAKQASEIWGITTRRISELCRTGKIKEAAKIGTAWIMPANAEKPSDVRIRSGKYVGIKRKKHSMHNSD